MEALCQDFLALQWPSNSVFTSSLSNRIYFHQAIKEEKQFKKPSIYVPWNETSNGRRNVLIVFVVQNMVSGNDVCVWKGSIFSQEWMGPGHGELDLWGQLTPPRPCLTHSPLRRFPFELRLVGCFYFPKNVYPLLKMTKCLQFLYLLYLFLLLSFAIFSIMAFSPF